MANRELDAAFYLLNEESILHAKNRKKRRKAFVDCTRYLRRKPQRRFQFYLGLANTNQGNYTQAVNLFKIARVIHPNSSASSTNNLGVALYHLRRYDEAILQFQKAIKIDPGRDYIGKSLPYANWSLVLYLQGKEKEAVKTLGENQSLITKNSPSLQERYKKILRALEKRLPKAVTEIERKQIEHLIQGVNWISDAILKI